MPSVLWVWMHTSLTPEWLDRYYSYSPSEKYSVLNMHENLSSKNVGQFQMCTKTQSGDSLKISYNSLDNIFVIC